MKYGLAILGTCAIALAMPAWAQPAGRDPNASAATQGPAAHGDRTARMDRTSSMPHHVRVVYPRRAHHRPAVAKGDPTSEDLNRQELTRLQGAAPAAPPPMPQNTALEGPKASSGGGASR